MSETPLSDWTPIAFLQREEERRRNEQKPAGAAPPGQDHRNNDERPLSGVTVVNLQRRFLLLEQRLAILEQREHERQIREKLDAASAQSSSGAPNGGGEYFGEDISVRQGEDYSQAELEPEFTYTKVEQEGLAEVHGNPDLDAQSHARGSSHDYGSKTPSDFVEIGPLRNEEAIQAEPARKAAEAFSSFIVTAFLACMIGFVGAILIVPAEKAVQFQTFVKLAVNAISEASHKK